MAAAEPQSADILDIQKKFEDIAKCPICRQTFTDPRILPCVHTFCAKCLDSAALKSSYADGTPMPCPMCRKEFLIPVGGTKTMPEDFLTKKLLEMSRSENSFQTHVACDSCSENNPGNEAPSAERFCRQCRKKLCETCCNRHRKGKLTKEHELIPVDESSKPTETARVQDGCYVHKSEQLKIYCLQCNKIICSLCFVEKHRYHKRLGVIKAGKEFEQQIQTGIENLRKHCTEIEAKRRDVISLKGDVDKIVVSQETLAYSKTDALLQLIEKLLISVTSELDQKRQEKLKEIKKEEEELDFQIQIQQCYIMCCQEILTKGSPVEICRVQSELMSRVEKLQKESQSVCQREAFPFEVDLKLNRFDKLQKHIEKRFAGCFEGERYRKGHDFVLHLGEKRATGMAIIDQELFVTTAENSAVLVYNAETFELRGSWSVTRLTRPEDMAASEEAKILYIFSAEEQGKISRIKTDGRVLSSWTIGCTKIRISTSLEKTTSKFAETGIVLTYVGTALSKEFGPSIQKKRGKAMSLKSNCNFVRKLEKGLYLFSTSTEVCSARVSERISYETSPVIFYHPEEIIVDPTTGFIFVNDRGNRRVVMLNSQLELEKEIVSRDAGLCDPRCMVLDGRNRRLLVADFDKVNKRGRILAVKVE